MAEATRQRLGEERLAWLRALPKLQLCAPLALVHGSPETPWRAPAPEAVDAELEAMYAPLAQSVAVYGHIHRPYIRSVSGLTVANSGSVSFSYDGDPRVEYDLGRELDALKNCALPHAGWIAKMLAAARPLMP